MECDGKNEIRLRLQSFAWCTATVEEICMRKSEKRDARREMMKDGGDKKVEDLLRILKLRDHAQFKQGSE
jgi:hypothetical protein